MASTSLALVRQQPTETMTPLSFDTIGYVLAGQFLGRAIQAAENARCYVEGDHWQNGKGWVGPRPPQSADGYDKVMKEIERAFTSRNAVLEVLERHALGVVGLEPTWGYTVRRPLREDEDITTEEQRLIDEAESIVTEWWDKRTCHQLFQDYVIDLLWAGRSSLRLYVPAGLLAEVEDGDEKYLVAEARNVEAALEMLYPDHPAPEDSTVYVEPLTQRWLGIVRYKTLVNWQPVGIYIYELTYLNDDGSTSIARLDRNQTTAYDFKLNGNLSMWESTRSPIITDALLQAQRALNLAISMLPRNVVTGGFLERVILNAQMPGEWIKDKDGNNIGFKPSTYVTGPATTNFISGQQYTDEEGKTHLATPDIKWRPPSETKPVAEAAAFHYEQILGEAKQIHILISGEAAPSGYSREQARADFADSLGTTAERAQSTGRWLLDTVLAFAEQIAGQPGYYTGRLKATFECRVNTGPISVEERTQNIAEVEAGTLSEETAMERGGVLDVDAEKVRINARPEAQLALLTKQLEVVTAAVLAGFSVELSSEMAGMDMKWINKYKKENEFEAAQTAEGLDKYDNPLPPSDPNSPDNPANQPPPAV
jgi:hypothetical protein